MVQILEPSWIHPGSLMTPFRLISEPEKARGPSLERIGSLVDSCWGRLGSILEPNWFLISYRVVWVQVGPILEPSWFRAVKFSIHEGLIGLYWTLVVILGNSSGPLVFHTAQFGIQTWIISGFKLEP